MIDPRTVSASYVRSLLETIEQQGVARADALRGLPLDEAQLAQANGRVALGVMGLLWQRGLQLTGDAGLGLKLGTQARPATFNVLGHALMNCATLGQALELMLRYQRLVSEAGTLSARRMADTVVLEYRAQPGLALLPQQVEGIVAGILSQSRWLAGRPVRPRTMAFAHALQAAPDAYRSALGVLPDFEAPLTLLELSAADLAAPLPQSDAAMCALHCRLADGLLEALPPIGFVSGFARQWLASAAPGAMRIDDLAAALATSVRTLQRQLAKEQVHWTVLADGARRDMALRLLQSGMTLEAAAQALGYHDASSLSRAVRRWSGQTPGRLRRST